MADDMKDQDFGDEDHVDSPRKKRITDFTRCATSFHVDEIEVACTVFMGLLSGTDLTVLTQRPEYRNLLGKFERMRNRMADKSTALDAIRDEMGWSEEPSDSC